MMDDPSTPTLVGCKALEQFLLLAKTAKGPAAVELVKQVLEAPGVYVFGELLETDCIKELVSSPSANYVRLLEVFAYGTYADYKANTSSLPSLTAAQLKKLKYLTIVSLAAKCKSIPYQTLLEALDIKDVRELEDLIIEAIYAGIIQAKLDQKNKQLEVECFIGRDIKVQAVEGMIGKLENWCANCASVLQAVEDQIQRANQTKVECVKEREKTDQEIRQLKQTLKVATSEQEEHLPRDQFPKTQVKKGIRGSGAHIKTFGKK